MKKTSLILIVLLVSTVFLFAQNNIIPAPVNYTTKQGKFALDKSKSIEIVNADFAPINKNLKEIITKNGGVVALKSPKKIIVEKLKTTNAKIGNEGYLLDIKPNIITIKANKWAGAFNGVQTLNQLAFNNFEIENCTIEDFPRFGWRGLMLDVSRHFFGVDDVKKYIDKMAEYKFNVLHWHLTDDEGWRIEIKALPKLTEIGAWRVERNGRFGEDRPFPKPGEKANYGGFYTQEQIKDIVKYAAEHNITIIPEIDVPGHSMAALAAYPLLSTKKEPHFVNPGSKFAEWYADGKFEMLVENTLNPADENVYDFVDKVMTEVAQLFPAEYIHMGGDECYHGFWERDSTVQKFMKANSIKNTHELQSYFVKRVEKIVNSKGKKLIGWDEILEGGLAENAAVMSWRGMKGGIEAAKLGHKVVMSPTTFAYLDYTQGDPSVENKIYASLSLKKSYEFEPVPEGVEEKYILGGQANLWTEQIPNINFAFYMTYPRALATAETVWSQKKDKNWANFEQRTEKHFAHFEKQNQSISKAVLDPIIKVSKDGEKLFVELSTEADNAEIYYTVNNTYPVNFGRKYTEKIEVPTGNLDLRTQTFRNGKELGRALRLSREDLIKRVK